MSGVRDPKVESPTSLSRPAPIRVVLADDHALLRSALRCVLEPVPDITVVGEAGTGEAALGVIAETSPDVVVLDLDISGEGGLATTQRVTAVEPHPAVLIVTMRTEPARLAEALHAGACGYVTKDLTAPDLIAAIRAAVPGDGYLRSDRTLVNARGATPSLRAPGEDQLSQYGILSRREQTVLRLVAEGHTGPEIGKQLGITAKTVDTYRHRIHHKIGLAHRTEYIRFALDLGLLARQIGE